MKSRIKGLGEVALRVTDLNKMADFYENIVGLAQMSRGEKVAFYRIAEGYGGHTQVIALFDRSDQNGYQGIDARKSTCDHFAFSIALEDFEFEENRLRTLGIEIETTTHPWVKWRSLYFNDPEGNQIEFVCYDKSL